MATAAAAGGFGSNTTARHEALIHDRCCESQLSVVYDTVTIALFITLARARIHAFVKRMELAALGECGGNGTQCGAAAARYHACTTTCASRCSIITE
jgi:hypothetical protein